MASRSLNKVTLLGNLTRDPELKYTPNGAPVCTFGLATNRSWTTADGQIKEETQYHRIIAWHKLAELCGKLLTKGKKAYLEGRIVYRSFTGKDGQQRNITEIILDDFIVFNGGKRILSSEQEETSSEKKETTTEGETQLEESGTTNEQKEETVNPDDIPF